MRDAIVFSGWAWETFNVPERISLALAHLGSRVLHCESPASFIRSRRPGLHEVENGIFSFQPVFVGHRLNHFAPLRKWQAASVAAQIFRQAEKLKLSTPLFFYSLLTNLLPLCAYMRQKSFLVHVHMDHFEWESEEHVKLSDLTLAIPRSVFHKLKAKHGEKVVLIPQAVDLRSFTAAAGSDVEASAALASIPRPRLGYLGPAHRNLNLSVLSEILRTHPDWHFISVGTSRAVPLANAHVVPWQGPQGVATYAMALDLGFMPYDCHNEERLHGVPLKLFEYFALGMPVVSTPLIHLWEYKDLVYLGDTAGELANATVAALNEPPDSPKRGRRLEVAREHSIERLADTLASVLPLAGRR